MERPDEPVSFSLSLWIVFKKLRHNLRHKLVRWRLRKTNGQRERARDKIFQVLLMRLPNVSTLLCFLPPPRESSSPGVTRPFSRIVQVPPKLTHFTECSNHFLLLLRVKKKIKQNCDLRQLPPITATVATT